MQQRALSRKGKAKSDRYGLAKITTLPDGSRLDDGAKLLPAANVTTYFGATRVDQNFHGLNTFSFVTPATHGITVLTNGMRNAYLRASPLLRTLRLTGGTMLHMRDQAAANHWFAVPPGIAVGVALIAGVLHSRNSPREVVVDSYAETHQDGVASLNNVRTAIGQVFTPSISAYLRSCKFYVSKERRPTGTVVAKLYAVTGTPGSTAVPTGSPLAVSAAGDVANFSQWPKF